MGPPNFSDDFKRDVGAPITERGYPVAEVLQRLYKTRERIMPDVFDYVAMSYNPVRKRVRGEMLSPVEFERQQLIKAKGVHKSRGYSQIPNDAPAARIPEAALRPQCRSPQ
jgi:hypothetical protein